VDCADHRICGDGDSDRAGSDLLYVGVLDKRSVLEFDFQDALLSVDRRNILLFNVSLFSFFICSDFYGIVWKFGDYYVFLQH
jgi:hypothetical protein